MATNLQASCSLNDLVDQSRPNVTPLLLVPSGILLVRGVSDQTVIGWQRALLLSCALAVVILILLSRINEEFRDPWPMLLVTSALMIPYGYGAVVIADVEFDRSERTVNHVRVEGKRVSGYRRHSYLLRLSPWPLHRKRGIGSSRTL
jgi:hypothetical protein